MVILSINFIWLALFALVIAFFIYKRKANKLTYIFIYASTVYILLVLSITMLPITVISKEELEEMRSHFGKYISYFQLVPFKTILGVGKFNFFRQIIGNIILFVPLPTIIKMNNQKLTGLKIILIGMLSSVGVELMQLIIDIVTRYPSHIADIDDVILNSIGVVIGYGIYIAINKWKFSRNLLEKVAYKNKINAVKM